MLIILVILVISLIVSSLNEAKRNIDDPDPFSGPLAEEFKNDNFDDNVAK